MFHLTTPTEVTCTDAHARPEFHGKHRVQAILLKFKLQGGNQYLDLIESGLRAHHYWNPAAAAGQLALSDDFDRFSDLRFPRLNREHMWGKSGEKIRGFDLHLELGLRDVVLRDCVLPPLHYTTNPKFVEIAFCLHYNGTALDDMDTLARLSVLATTGKVRAQLFAPKEMVLVKKNWRSGDPDWSGDDAEDDEHSDGLFGNGGSDDDEAFPEGSPEAAFAGAIAAPTETARPAP
jgi:hypothetical protein